MAPFLVDVAVSELYQNNEFKNLVRKAFQIKRRNQIKFYLKQLILSNKLNLKLEK